MTALEESSSYRQKIVAEVLQYLEEAKVTSIEFEGADVAVYVKNPRFIAENEEKLKELAKTLKKRIVIRTDPRVRLPKEQTVEFILANVPEDVSVSPEDIQFDEIMGEVRVLTDKPGKLLGKGAQLRYRMLAETGWRLEVYRKPMMKSKVLEGVLRHLSVTASVRRKTLLEIGERIFRDPVVGTKYVRVVGLGGFSEIGRSAILIDTGESKVLLDSGISPADSSASGIPNFDAPEFRIEDLDAVVVTHAHLDHIASLPLLYKYGYRGPVFMTLPTRDLVLLLLTDFIELAKKEGREPLYTMKELSLMMSRIITVGYNSVTDVAPDIKLTLVDAGHVLGSSLVHLHIGQGLFNIVYTGDIKYYRIKTDKALRLLPPAEDTFHRVEALIIEGTYGSKNPQPREKAEEELVNVINKAVERKGKVLIPVMAVGRSQEMLYILNTFMKEKKIPEIPIYVDGMIYEATAIYTEYPELLSKQPRDIMMYHGENIFLGSTTVYVNDESTRTEAIESQGPAVILSTSGMMTGGPVLEYFKHLAPDEKNILAFVTYQAPGTLARRLAEGLREVDLPEDGKVKKVKVNMEVTAIEGFTGHATRDELLNFLKHLKPKPRSVILCHGEPSSLLSLGVEIKRSWERLNFQGPPEVVIPENLESIKLYPRSGRIHVALDYAG
ncbi:MAG: beta-CASP ribonuclease aCPSF1 [Acidilobaceae archaeon]